MKNEDYLKILEKEHQRVPQKGGFFPLPEFPEKKKEDKDICNDPEHKPPTHICIPQGMGYKHICPSCGKISVIIPPQYTL